MENLETWQFGIDNDYLVGLVLSGKKTATTSIYDEKDIPKVNEESILLFESKKKACVLKTKKVIITDLNSTDETPEIIEKIQKDYEYINVLDWKECKDIIDSVDKN